MLKKLLIVLGRIKGLIIEQEPHQQVSSAVTRVHDYVKGLVAIVCQEPIVPSVKVDSEPGALGLQVDSAKDPLRREVHAQGCSLS